MMTQGTLDTPEPRTDAPAAQAAPRDARNAGLLGVDAPRAAPEPLAKRPCCASAGTLASLLFLLAVAVLATLPGFLPGRVYAPTDLLKTMPPWRTDAQFQGNNEALFDQTTQFAPWSVYTRARLAGADADLPLWNPHQQLGEPFIANGQSAVFYPTTWLHAALPPQWSWTLSACLRLWIAGVGTWLLAGRMGVSRPARLLAAVAFMLCGFNVVWLNHPHVNVTALLPWALFATQKLIDRPTVLRMAGMALVVALQFFGGHPASSAHLLLSCGLLWGANVIFLSWKKSLISLPAIGVAMGIGGLCAAMQLLPLKEYIDRSGAMANRAQTAAAAPMFAMRPVFLLGAVFPYANGYPGDGVTPYQIQDVTGLPNANELAAPYAGVVTLGLAVAGLLLARRRQMWALVFVGGAALLIAIRFPVVDWAVARTPGLSMAQNSRLLVTTALCVALLGAMGLDAFIARLAGLNLRRIGKWLMWSGAAVAAVGLIASAAVFLARSPILRHGEAQVEAAYNADAAHGHEHSLDEAKRLVERIWAGLALLPLRLLIPAALLALAGWMIRRKATTPRCRLAPSHWTWVALATAELLAFAMPYNRGSPISTYFPDEPAIGFLQARQKALPAAPFRFTGDFRVMHPETATAYGLDDIRGYDALTSNRYWQWMNAVDRASPDPEIKRIQNADARAFDLLALRYLMTAPPSDHQALPDPARWKRVFPEVGKEPGSTAFVYENAGALPRAWVAARVERVRGPASAAQVDKRVAAMDFKPRDVVLVDDEFENIEWTPADKSDADGEHMQDVLAREASAAPGRSREAASVRFLAQPPQAADEKDRDKKLEKLQRVSPEHVRLSVTSPAGGWLVFSESYDPGWTASIVERGRTRPIPVFPAYGLLMTTPVPAGTSEVVFEYQPRSFRLGEYASTAGAAALLALLGAAMVGSLLRPHDKRAAAKHVLAGAEANAG